MTFTFIFHRILSILKQGSVTHPAFWILSILLTGQPGQQSPQFGKFSPFFFLLIIIRYGKD